MRKLAALLLLLPILLAGLPASAQEPLGTVKQTVAGSVALPTRFTNPEQGYPGLGRRLWLAASASNGAVAHIFDVDPQTWGGAFVMDGVTDATGQADLGIYFYADFGGLEVLNGPHNAVSTGEYDARAAGGETGFIPPGSKKALVFTYNGVRSQFTYRGYSMPTISLSSGDLDLTVPNGAFVGWVNDTNDYAFVQRTQTPVTFSSGSGPASGLRKGEVFRFQFTRNGVYTYETSAGSGTITVVAGPGPGTPAS